MPAAEISIAGRRIALDTEPWVIAEIGHNHQGDIGKAESLIRAAHEAGADAVKFQKRDNRSLYTPEEYDAPYNSEHAFGPTYGAHREALELGWDEYRHLKAFAESFGLIFFATAFDVPSVHFLANLGVQAIKIGSGQITNARVLAEAADVGVPLILSTGGCDLWEVERAIDRIRAERPFQDALLQCTSIYPCEASQMNLSVLRTYRELFSDAVLGLSDHYDGIAMGSPAFLLGARIFEKHFTLNRAWKGSDQALSLEPEGLRRYVRDLHATRLALGDGVKRRLEAEIPALRKMGRRDV
jgi:N-acetylneuraminate synthase/sialic acid synthase